MRRSMLVEAIIAADRKLREDGTTLPAAMLVAGLIVVWFVWATTSEYIEHKPYVVIIPLGILVIHYLWAKGRKEVQ